MENLTVFLSRDLIREKVDELATRIREDYRGTTPLLVGALKGSFIFMSDLIRALDMPLEVDFISVSSYGSGQESSGRIELRQDLKTPAADRDILLVEDIIDTGLTSSFIMENLRRKNPSSLRICSLLDKPSRRRTDISIDYLGFTVPDKFIVGYGLDFNELYRHLPDICCREGE